MSGLSYGDCDGCGKFDWMAEIPRIGEFCPACIEKLSRPQVLEGVVECAPFADIWRKRHELETQAEQRGRQRAIEICRGE